MPLSDLRERPWKSSDPYYVPVENFMSDWLSINFKTSINRAKNGTLLLNYRDTIAVQTERFFALIHRSNIGDACL